MLLLAPEDLNFSLLVKFLPLAMLFLEKLEVDIVNAATFSLFVKNCKDFWLFGSLDDQRLRKTLLQETKCDGIGNCLIFIAIFCLVRDNMEQSIKILIVQMVVIIISPILHRSSSSSWSRYVPSSVEHRASAHSSGSIDGSPVMHIFIIVALKLPPAIHAAAIITILMSFLVSCEVGTLGESLVAAWVSTDVGLLTCVGSQMGTQIEV